jgi:glyoxylase-like metal-dependent hydrolase (beta-lactamase superfamily II)
MTKLEFDRSLNQPAGACRRVSPLVRRVVCGNTGPFTFTGTCSYIIGNGTVAIIDPGPDDDFHFEARAAAVSGETVSHILITHSHADHSPLGRRLAAMTGARIGGHGGLGGIADMAIDSSIDRDFSPHVALSSGDTIEGPGWTLDALHTPGHLADHLCFALREERVLFSGDHVMFWSTSIVAPPHGHMGDYMTSLGLLAGRGDSIYFPAHGPERREPLPYVAALIAHRKAREAAVMACLARGRQSAGEIAADVYRGLDPALMPAAILSTRAHLDWLVESGRARHDGEAYEAVGKR